LPLLKFQPSYILLWCTYIFTSTSSYCPKL